MRISTFPHFFLLLVGTALFLTFSRSAWIGALLALTVAVAVLLRGRERRRILVCIAAFILCAGIILALSAPRIFLRGLSNAHHVDRLREGLSVMIAEPLGRGLGMAGPAANRLRDPCVFFPDGADTSWARSRDDLCIFVGGAQVRPPVSARICACAFLPENWYLQIGVELGVVGFVLFLLLTLLILRALARRVLLASPVAEESGAVVIFLAFLGISVAALFLHAWDDSAVAYTTFILAGIALAPRPVTVLARVRRKITSIFRRV